MGFRFPLWILIVAVAAITDSRACNSTGINTTQCSQAEMDVVFILDSSRSVNSSNFDLMKDFVQSFLQETDVDGNSTRVGVVIFGFDAQVIFRLDDFTTKGDVLNAVAGIQFLNESSNTAASLRSLREDFFNGTHGDRPGVPNVAILVTDGDSDDTNDTIRAAQEARAEGIVIYSIGIGVLNSTELDFVSSPPVNETRFDVQDFSNLTDLCGVVFSTVCTAISQTQNASTSFMSTAISQTQNASTSFMNSNSTDSITTTALMDLTTTQTSPETSPIGDFSTTTDSTTILFNATHSTETTTILFNATHSVHDNDTMENSTSTGEPGHNIKDKTKTLKPTSKPGETEKAGASTNQSQNAGVIAGAVIGALAFVAVGIAFGVYRYRKSRLAIKPEGSQSVDGEQTAV